MEAVSFGGQPVTFGFQAYPRSRTFIAVLSEVPGLAVAQVKFGPGRNAAPSTGALVLGRAARTIGITLMTWTNHTTLDQLHHV